jgi:formate-dependent nitrite reductase cytochrome c552 subunit
MASRMLIIMNRYNQTGGSDAFLMVFSCAGNDCGAGACGRGRAGRRSRGRGGGGMMQSKWVVGGPSVVDMGVCDCCHMHKRFSYGKYEEKYEVK